MLNIYFFNAKSNIYRGVFQGFLIVFYPSNDFQILQNKSPLRISQGASKKKYA